MTGSGDGIDQRIALTLIVATDLDQPVEVLVGFEEFEREDGAVRFLGTIAFLLPRPAAGAVALLMNTSATNRLDPTRLGGTE